jgi:NADH dehydrogenase [ubiquinone] 1 alpha subcomplex assembly factor 7
VACHDIPQPPEHSLLAAPEPGAILETRPASSPLLHALGRRAQGNPVAALIVDYGYERDAYGDTLQAVRGHGYDDPLANPGAADLSAHVNFAELARMAQDGGLAAWGPLPQGEFLLALGLEARLQKLLSSARPEQRAGLITGARRLTDPYQMGALFKAMALTGRDMPAPPPFPQTRRDR